MKSLGLEYKNSAVGTFLWSRLPGSIRNSLSDNL